MIGIVGWKQSGKTTLTTRLITWFAERGYEVGSIKHAHHAFRVDDDDTDSARHRRAGARQVAVASATKWAVISQQPETDHRPDAAPDLMQLANRLDAVDLIIVEGFKRSEIAKIEARRDQALECKPLHGTIPNVVAIAADHDVAEAGCEVFALDDIDAVAAFIIDRLELRGPRS